MDPSGNRIANDRAAEVGRRIRSFRKNLGLSQTEFAKRINATVPAVSNWENGRNLPNNERLKKIAEFGDLSIRELLHGPSKDYENMWKELKKEVEITTNDELGNPATQYYLENFLKVMNKLEEEK